MQTRKCNAAKIGALGIPVTRSAHEDYCMISLRGDRCRLGNLRFGRKPAYSYPDSGDIEVDVIVPSVLGDDLASTAGFERDFTHHLLAAFLEECGTTCPGSPSIHHKLAVHIDPAKPGRG
ncbi:hypothetical protein D3C80_1729840 [compost metagenome]